MAHNIQERDIQVGLAQAWHGKTVIVPKIDRGNCGIVYGMEKRPLVLADGTPTDFYGIVSTDDNRMIGNPIKKGYQLFSNERMMDAILEALAGTSHTIESVGSVADRSKVFCSIKLAENFVAAGRETKSQLNVLWGHGGVFRVVTRTGVTVIVCENTFNASQQDGKTDFCLSVKHTGNAELKIANIGKAIDAHFGVTAEFQAAMRSFDATSETEKTARQFAAGFLVRDPLPEITEVSTRTINTIDRIVQLFNGGAGNKGKTRADLFNGLTDYFTHESSGGEDTWKQFESSEFGQADKRKGEAFALLNGSELPDVGDYSETMERGNRVLQFA